MKLGARGETKNKTKPVLEDVVVDVPFPDSDLELYVDRSSYYLYGSQVTSHSVTNADKTMEASPLHVKLRVQPAEFIALTKTCQLFKEKSTNILILCIWSLLHHWAVMEVMRVYNF